LSSKPKMLADENIPRSTIQSLQSSGFDIVSIWEVKPGLSDDEVVQLAVGEDRIIITFDKDFRRLALTNPAIPGLLLLRVPPINPKYVTSRILSALNTIGNPYGKLTVVRKRTVKIIPLR